MPADERTRHCRSCRYGNPPENRLCGSCGAPLAGAEIMPRQNSDPVAAGRALPKRIGPIGRSLAVGATILATEAGLAWLRRRAGGGGRAASPVARDADAIVPAYVVGRSLEEVIIRTRGGNPRGTVLVQRAVRSFVVAGSPVGRR